MSRSVVDLEGIRHDFNLVAEETGFTGDAAPRFNSSMNLADYLFDPSRLDAVVLSGSTNHLQAAARDQV